MNPNRTCFKFQIRLSISVISSDAFWAAALEGLMTYGTRQGKFFVSPISYLLLSGVLGLGQALRGL